MRRWGAGWPHMGGCLSEERHGHWDLENVRRRQAGSVPSRETRGEDGKGRGRLHNLPGPVQNESWGPSFEKWEFQAGDGRAWKRMGGICVTAQVTCAADQPGHSRERGASCGWRGMARYDRCTCTSPRYGASGDQPHRPTCVLHSSPVTNEPPCEPGCHLSTPL